MELTDAVVVVTGGGSGIGAALCDRFAADASAVVVVDLDGEHATRTVEHVREAHPAPEVWARTVDVSDPTAVAQLVDDVLERHGRIDLYCSNAGIGSGMGVEAPEEVWQRVWDVNLMAHVHALRALLPDWLARGAGHLLVTASAAGLLTNLGDAPYSVTKHGAVALAEWVSVTYGDRGLGVSCLCPQGVRTPLLFGGADGDAEPALATEVVKAQRILEPEDVASFTAAAVASDTFLVLPHEEVAAYERARAGDRERWLAAMRRLQATVDAARRR